MNSKLLLFLLFVSFAACLASQSEDMARQDELDEEALMLRYEKQERLNGQFIAAVKERSIELMTELVAQGADVNARGALIGFSTALCYAANHGHLDSLRALINLKADVNRPFEFGGHNRTALHEAAKNGHIGCVRALIEAGANVNIQDDHGSTALHWAVWRMKADCVKALIEAKADVNIRVKDGETALHFAARNNDYNGLIVLLQAKADGTVIDQFGHTPLRTAIDKYCIRSKVPHEDLFKALIQSGTDVNFCDRSGTSLFHIAASCNCIDWMEALIGAKADVTLLDRCFGKTAHFFAAHNGHLDAVKVLVKYGYLIVPPATAVAESRKRLLRLLGVFVGLRNQHPELDNLKDATLQYEILSWDKSLQEDLVIVLLDELKKGQEIKAVALIRSKEAAVRYIIKKLGQVFSSISSSNMKPDLIAFLDPAHIEESFGALVKEGLDARFEKLKVKKNV